MQSIMRTFCAPPPFRLWDLCGRRGGTSESDSFVKVLDASPSLLGLCYQSIPLKNFRPLLKKEIFTLVVSSSFSEESKKYVMTNFFFGGTCQEAMEKWCTVRSSAIRRCAYDVHATGNYTGRKERRHVFMSLFSYLAM